MKLKHLILLGACTVLSACATEPGSSSTGSESAAASTGPSLDYEKFTLDNGLEVILHRDTSDPIVAVTTVIHAGSGREKTGRTGFAHFFEHMAFNDSENVPRGWNRKAIPDWGGSRNGGTWSDGTIYYEVVPKDAFDKILWIDSDRLGYMINTVTQAALEAEIQVVKNEKRQRYDNAPYGYTSEIIAKNLYPEGHPYSWTTIGSLPDLQAATLDDLKEFYFQYYGAGNVTLAIAGDIDIEETREKVERWFGEIRQGPDIAPPAPMPVTLDATRSIYWEDNFARLPELRITYPVVEQYHPDEAALTVLGQYLGNSKNSPLYRNIVEAEKLAPSVSSYSYNREIAGEFVVRVRANAGVDLDAVKAQIDTSLAEFAATGIPEDELKRVKAEWQTSLYQNLTTVLGKSQQLAQDNEFSGDPVRIFKEVERIRQVSADDVMRVYETYIAGKPAVMTSFVPQGAPELALDGARMGSVWVEEVTADNAEENVTRGDVATYEKTPSIHDRSEPPFGELPLVTMPAVWERELADGVRLLGIEYDEVPLVQFEIVIDGGSALEPVAQKGVADLLARLMNEGTALKSAAEFEAAVGLLGSDISVNAYTEEIVISGTALAENFEETVALAMEVLAGPRFADAEFERVKTAALTDITGREANPNSIASLAFFKLIYGANHPYGMPQSGTAETVGNLTLEDVKAHYAELFDMATVIHVAGDIDPARAQAAFAGIAAEFSGSGERLPAYDVPAQAKGGNVYFIDVPGSKQSVLYIGKLALATDDPDFNRLSFTNEKLGGGISGDLAQVLRIEKGYTYGAYSYLINGKIARPFIASTSVRANATEDSLRIIREMIDVYADAFSAEDVEVTQQKLIKENTRAFESLGAKLGTLRDISKYGKSKTFVEDEQQELLAMTLDDFKATARAYLREDDMLYVVVGDRETQFDPVTAFAGVPVIELDIYGDPLE